jgi:hypothetical protein
MRIAIRGYASVGAVIMTLVTASFLFGDISPVSSAPRFENKCADGVDNDGDGLTDTDDPDCSGSGGDGGGNTGNGQDTQADIYLVHDTAHGIIGDGWFTGGDPLLNPSNAMTMYPADKTLSGTLSCAGAIVTDQAQGYVRMFSPAGDGSSCGPANYRILKIRTDYDLDQDGLCGIPYTGRSNARGFTRFYPCVGLEPDLGYEDVMVTMHLHEVLGPGVTTTVGFQIRLLDYGDEYVPTPGVDPDFAAIEFIGSQERAFNIEMQGVTTTQPDDADGTVRVFANTQGTATICQVEWKNANAKDCKQIVDEFGEPIVMMGLTMEGKVDPTPYP